MQLRTLLASVLLSSQVLHAADHDIVIYGGTCSAIIAAVQAKKMGKSVIVVSPDKHLGGLSSGGLGSPTPATSPSSAASPVTSTTASGSITTRTQPGCSRRNPNTAAKARALPAMDGANRTMWIFEPHVAEQIFEDYVREFGLEVVRDEWLDRANGVKKDGDKISSITTLSGKTYAGKMFIDATYEGDLMAAAGVDYHVGREAQSVYDEKWNGVQVGVLHHGHHFGSMNISPYVVPGDPKSGVLPHINTEPVGEYGSGDKKVQAYCFRMCLTNDPANRIPFAKPEGYDPKEFELLVRVFDKGWKDVFHKFDPIPNHKTDTNNHGPFSTDNIGRNWDYPEASYEAPSRDHHRA